MEEKTIVPCRIGVETARATASQWGGSGSWVTNSLGEASGTGTSITGWDDWDEVGAAATAGGGGGDPAGTASRPTSERDTTPTPGIARSRGARDGRGSGGRWTREPGLCQTWSLFRSPMHQWCGHARAQPMAVRPVPGVLG